MTRTVSLFKPSSGALTPSSTLREAVRLRICCEPSGAKLMKIHAAKRVIVFDPPPWKAPWSPPFVKICRTPLLKSVDKISDTRHGDPEILEVVDFRGKVLKSCPGDAPLSLLRIQDSPFWDPVLARLFLLHPSGLPNQPNLRLFGNLDEMFA